MIESLSFPLSSDWSRHTTNVSLAQPHDTNPRFWNTWHGACAVLQCVFGCDLRLFEVRKEEVEVFDLGAAEAISVPHSVLPLRGARDIIPGSHNTRTSERLVGSYSISVLDIA